MIGESLGAPGTQESTVARSLQSVTCKLLGGSGTPAINSQGHSYTVSVVLSQDG